MPRTHITIHSSRHRFAARLNSGVRPTRRIRVTPMKTIALATLLLLGGCTAHGNLITSTSQGMDSQEIFRTVLQGWLDRNESENSFYVAKSTHSLPEAELEELTTCANNGTAESITLTLEPVAKISRVISNPRLHFINRRFWLMPDPKRINESIQTGRPVSIISLSSIAFNQSKSIAVLQFSLVCGTLCGYGETLVFDKTASGWVQRSQTCEAWIS